MTCWNDGNSFAKALRSPKIEFILAQHPWMENDCLFADIVLPVSTKFEEDDIGCDECGGQYQIVVDEKKCINTLGEAKSDYEIVCLIAERLGMLEQFTQGRSIQDWIKLGFDNCGIAESVSWEEFREKGYYVVPTAPEWQKYPPGMSEFYHDPDNNPLTTPTGKIEIYSQALADHFPDDEERTRYPRWRASGATREGG